MNEIVLRLISFHSEHLRGTRLRRCFARRCRGAELVAQTPETVTEEIRSKFGRIPGEQTSPAWGKATNYPFLALGHWPG